MSVASHSTQQCCSGLIDHVQVNGIAWLSCSLRFLCRLPSESALSTEHLRIADRLNQYSHGSSQRSPWICVLVISAGPSNLILIATELTGNALSENQFGASPLVLRATLVSRLYNVEHGQRLCSVFVRIAERTRTQQMIVFKSHLAVKVTVGRHSCA